MQELLGLVSTHSLTRAPGNYNGYILPGLHSNSKIESEVKIKDISCKNKNFPLGENQALPALKEGA